MPYQNYEDSFRKDSSTQDVMRKRKDMVRRDSFSKERRERYKRYITFFRLNPSIFIKEYFGIHLHPFQILMIWMLQRSYLAYIVASRAVGKSWIIAVWSLTLAVLFPQIQIIICAKTIKQGAIILSEKLTSLRNTYPNVAREIVSITCNANVNEAIFRSGSSIKVVPSSENSRGKNSCLNIWKHILKIAEEIWKAETLIRVEDCPI